MGTVETQLSVGKHQLRLLSILNFAATLHSWQNTFQLIPYPFISQKNGCHQKEDAVIEG